MAQYGAINKHLVANMTAIPTYKGALTITNRCAAFRALLTSEAMIQVVQAYQDAVADEGMMQIADLGQHLAPWCDPCNPVGTFVAGALEATDQLSLMCESAGWNAGLAPSPMPSLGMAWHALRINKGSWSVGGVTRCGTRREEAVRPPVAQAQLFARMLIGGYRYHVNDYDLAMPAEATFAALTKKIGRHLGAGMFQVANTTLDMIALAQSTPDWNVVVGVNPATMEATTAVISDSLGPENLDTAQLFRKFDDIYLLTDQHWLTIEQQDLQTLTKLAHLRHEASYQKAAA